MLQYQILRNAPTTRFQGSKRRVLTWLYENFRKLDFETVLDGFGGTGSVSYLFKLMGKRVAFNDVLRFNYLAGVALVENDDVRLTENDVNFVVQENGFEYPSFIQKTFRDMYYLTPENKWLDIAGFNIRMLSEFYTGDVLRKKQAIAYHALFQACLCKRPFNLFHRRNLYLRRAQVDRSFGNKTTWDIEFPALFRKFCVEYSRKVFSNGLESEALCCDIMKIRKRKFDLVYLDPPYCRPDEKPIDYRSLYHFLEGLTDYDNWGQNINWRAKTKCLLPDKTSWCKNSVKENLNTLFKRFRDSIIVISYGEPGYPSIVDIQKMLQQYKRKVSVVKRMYKYSLNCRNSNHMKEVLIIGT